MFEDTLSGRFWVKEGNGLFAKKRQERLVRINYDQQNKKATLEVTSLKDISVRTVYQHLDCNNQCLLITEKASKKGKLALVPTGACDMDKGLVLEHRDRDALRVWEERLRKHLRVVSYPVVIETKQRKQPATIHISPTRLYLTRGFPPKFLYLGSWDISMYAQNLVVVDSGILHLDVHCHDGGPDGLTMTTEHARDIHAIVTRCLANMAPAQDLQVNMDRLVPRARRRLASMPTSIRNELSLRMASTRSSRV